MRTVTAGHYQDILSRNIVPDAEAEIALSHAVQLLEARGYRHTFTHGNRATLVKYPSEIAYVTVTDTVPSDFVPTTYKRLCHPY